MFNKIYWIALLYDHLSGLPVTGIVLLDANWLRSHEVITFQDTGFYVWTSGKEKDGFNYGHKTE